MARTQIGYRNASAYPIELSYSRTDPYELGVTFDGTKQLCARDLLIDAVARIPAGIGDVHIRCNGKHAYIGFASSDDGVVARILRSDAEKFVTETLEMVPRGDESYYLDVDAAVSRIIASAGAN